MARRHRGGTSGGAQHQHLFAQDPIRQLPELEDIHLDLLMDHFFELRPANRAYNDLYYELARRCRPKGPKATKIIEQLRARLPRLVTVTETQGDTLDGWKQSPPPKTYQDMEYLEHLHDENYPIDSSESEGELDPEEFHKLIKKMEQASNEVVYLNDPRFDEKTEKVNVPSDEGKTKDNKEKASESRWFAVQISLCQHRSVRSPRFISHRSLAVARDNAALWVARRLEVISQQANRRMRSNSVAELTGATSLGARFMSLSMDPGLLSLAKCHWKDAYHFASVPPDSCVIGRIKAHLKEQHRLEQRSGSEEAIQLAMARWGWLCRVFLKEIINTDSQVAYRNFNTSLPTLLQVDTETRGGKVSGNRAGDGSRKNCLYKAKVTVRQFCPLTLDGSGGSSGSGDALSFESDIWTSDELQARGQAVGKLVACLRRLCEVIDRLVTVFEAIKMKNKDKNPSQLTFDPETVVEVLLQNCADMFTLKVEDDNHNTSSTVTIELLNVISVREAGPQAKQKACARMVRYLKWLVNFADDDDDDQDKVDLDEVPQSDAAVDGGDVKAADSKDTEVDKDEEQKNPQLE